MVNMCKTLSTTLNYMGKNECSVNIFIAFLLSKSLYDNKTCLVEEVI